MKQQVHCPDCLFSNVNMVDGMMMVQFGACVDINEDMVIIVKNMLLLEIN